VYCLPLQARHKLLNIEVQNASVEAVAIGRNYHELAGIERQRGIIAERHEALAFQHHDFETAVGEDGDDNGRAEDGCGGAAVFDDAAAFARRRMEGMLPFSKSIVRPDDSNVNTVFAPMRVMVLSAAVNSTRDAGPVRTRSGALNNSLVLAGVATWVDAATTLASLMISVKTLSVSGVAACAVRQPKTTNNPRK